MGLPVIDGLLRLDDATLAALRERLQEAGYEEGFIAAVEAVAPLQLDAIRLPLVWWWLERKATPAALLAELFSYRRSVESVRLRGVLGDELTSALLGCGVLETDDGRLRSRLELMPHDGLLFFSDRLEDGEEAVMGPGMTTVLLHRLLAVTGATTVLDLGCGAGSLAIAAARKGARAVGTDLSRRAVDLAALNARLNEVQVELLQGDVTAPVRGERFDLVLAQPPYVPLPGGEQSSTYLHGGHYGDELAMKFVGESARVLADGGLALLRFDSAVRPDQPLVERLRAALGDAPVDVVALVDRAPTPDHQSIAYAASAHPDLGPEYRRLAARRREHLESLGVREVSQVLLALRRPSDGGSPGGRFSLVLPVRSLARMRPGAVGDLLAALDVASLPEEALLARRFAPLEGARFVEERASPSSEPDRLAMHLPADALAQDRELGERGWVLLGLLADGSVGEAIARFAELCEAPEPRARREVLGFVRESLALGLLRPLG